MFSDGSADSARIRIGSSLLRDTEFVDNDPGRRNSAPPQLFTGKINFYDVMRAQSSRI